MYKKVLLCFDGTAEGRRALRRGADVVLCMRSSAHVLAICRSMVSGAVPEGITPALVNCDNDAANALLREGVEWLQARGIAAEGSLVFGNPINEIAAAAERLGVDLIVLGHRHRSRLARWWSEPEQAQLLDRVNCSILVAMAEEE